MWITTKMTKSDPQRNFDNHCDSLRVAVAENVLWKDRLVKKTVCIHCGWGCMQYLIFTVGLRVYYIYPRPAVNCCMVLIF
jgi:predicted molibdopterin-dependent oxidoreductase YjgC